MAFFRSGQGSTEYIIMFGAVLIIALVAVSLMNFAPSTSSDASETESGIYWRSQAKPFLVQEAIMKTGRTWACGDSQGQIIFRMKNTDKWPISLLEIYLNNIKSERFCAYDLSAEGYLGQTNESFLPGQERSIWIPGNNTSLCANGTKSEPVQITFKYDTPHLSGKVQNGTMKIYINCGNESSPSSVCNEAVCTPAQSCCALKSPNYCYNTVGGICNSCGGACSEGRTCYEGTCSIACGGGYCNPANQQCCALAGDICIDSGLTCDACGGACLGGQTCYNGVCSIACGGIYCKPANQQCCEGGPVPACISETWTCDICGGCDPIETACCPKDKKCTANGVACKDGTIACYGVICKLGQVCDTKLKTCSGK